jgi:hypothetical protein
LQENVSKNHLDRVPTAVTHIWTVAQKHINIFKTIF